MRFFRCSLCFLAVALLYFSTGPVPALGASEQTIGPGVTWKRIKARGPNVIHVVTVDLSERSTIDVALATDRVPGAERTSSMARRHDAIAAINGDFTLPSGRPASNFVADGVPLQSAMTWGRNFSIDVDENNAYYGHPDLRSSFIDDSGVEHFIHIVNARAPRYDQLALFTPAGAGEELPPRRACAARIRPTSQPRFQADSPGVERTYVVDSVRCSKQRMARRGSSVLAAPLRSLYAPDVRSLDKDESITVTWSLGWPRVEDTIGGNPVLVAGGRNVVENGSTPFFSRNPRTGVGTTSNGKLLMVTVDGRRPSSVGMTLKQFGRLFLRLGADWALNLDGGGSTTMVVGGEVKNRPADGNERAVSSALLVLPGADPDSRVAPSLP
jgi:hypothetical protein